MEELLAYALLYCESIVQEEEYEKKLNELFEKNPENDLLLELEFMPDMKENILYLRAHMDYNKLSHSRFGQALMEKLKPYYECVGLRGFADAMWLLWKSLPDSLQDEEPFHTMSYADDPLSWGDVQQAMELYEYVLHYYDTAKEVSGL